MYINFTLGMCVCVYLIFFVVDILLLILILYNITEKIYINNSLIYINLRKLYSLCLRPTRQSLYKINTNFWLETKMIIKWKAYK